MAWQAPNNAWLATTRSPLSSWQAEAKIAAIPVEQTRQASALYRGQPLFGHLQSRVAIARINKLSVSLKRGRGLFSAIIYKAGIQK